ncbi:MAG: hypothetical protein QXF76_01265 [Candidatus Anstonellales archaeon]
MPKPDKILNGKKNANRNIKIVYYESFSKPKLTKADIIASHQFYQILNFFST